MYHIYLTKIDINTLYSINYSVQFYPKSRKDKKLHLIEFNEYLEIQIDDCKKRFTKYIESNQINPTKQTDINDKNDERDYIACDRVLRFLLQIGLELLNQLKCTSTSDSKWNEISDEDDEDDEDNREDIEFKSFSSTNPEEREHYLLPLINLFDTVTQHDLRENRSSFSFLTEKTLDDDEYYVNVSSNSSEKKLQESPSLQLGKINLLVHSVQ